MDDLKLTTPENVPISYELAGIGSRFVSALLDGLIITAIQGGLWVIVVVVLAVERDTPEGPPAVILALAVFLTFAIFGCYDLIFEIVWSGQTPGKRKVGLRVVRDDGSPITAIAAVIRNVVRLADFLPAYYIIGIVVMLIDSKCRRLGDLAAGTMVVKERRDIAVGNLTLGATHRAPAAHAAPGIEGAVPVTLRRLSYADYHLVQEYLLRREELAPAAAHDLAVRIAGVIAAKLEVDSSAEAPEDFVARIGRALEGESRDLA